MKRFRKHLAYLGGLILAAVPVAIIIVFFLLLGFPLLLFFVFPLLLLLPGSIVAGDAVRIVAAKVPLSLRVPIYIAVLYGLQGGKYSRSKCYTVSVPIFHQVNTAV